jgi:hypothetical protein
VPEIELNSGAETVDEAWLAEGFVRAPAAVPVKWHLFLLTFDTGQPTITPIDMQGEGNTAVVTVTRNGVVRAPILIVAAIAPATLQSIPYSLNLD